MKNTKNILEILSLLIVLILLCFAIFLDLNKKDKDKFDINNDINDAQIEFFKENFDDKIQYYDWENYRNDKYKFGIQIPKEWVTKEYENNIYFGPQNSFSGGGFWGVSVYKISESKKINEIISSTGMQFGDRKEQIININSFVKKIIVTTEEKSDWFSEKYIIYSKDYIYILGNGAIKNNKFEMFFGSFGII